MSTATHQGHKLLVCPKLDDSSVLNYTDSISILQILDSILAHIQEKIGSGRNTDSVTSKYEKILPHD